MIAVGGILFALMLLVVAAVDPAGFRALRGASLDATHPISAGGRGVVRFFQGIGSGVSNYFMAASENAELKKRLDSERRMIVEARATELENQRLKALLKLVQETQNPVAVTRVVGSAFDGPRRLATLAAGTSSGIQAGQ
ncbi:MAG: rod shape-determining protein MreC, partial [Alphaproteobacteria bacterium]|nr:rod shape-determining protein MreC [Alphaproteobacteria bacterium]